MTADTEGAAERLPDTDDASPLLGVVDALQRMIAGGDDQQDVLDSICASARRLTSADATIVERLGVLLRDVDIDERKGPAADVSTARDAATDSARLRSEFLANMSHEIRTPLNGVLGMLHLLADGPLSVEQQEYAGIAESSAEALLTVIDDNFDFSRIEAGLLECVFSVTDLRCSLEGLLAQFRPRASTKGLELTVELAAGVPEQICTDGGRLRQVLTNLVGNAVKFTESGSIVISAAVAGSAQKPLLALSVSDTGIGMSPEQQLDIFDSIVQGGTATTRLSGGSGLGLAISQRLAWLLGGTLTVQSRPAVGSTFTLRLPLPVSGAAHAPVPAPRALVPTLTKGRALVAEDNPVNQRVAIGMLRKLGYDVETADNGAEAVQALTEGARFDAVLMDCRMPNMDGYEATARIRKLKPPACRTPVIALTASAMAGDRERCLEVGMDDHMAKPIRLVELSAMLGKWIPPASAA